MLFASVTYTCNLEGKRNCTGDYADTYWCSYLSKKMRVNFRFLKARSKIRFKLSTTHIYSFDFLELYQQLLGA